MNENEPDDKAETFQAGATPVQSFVVRAIPPEQGVPLELRRGRPPRPAAGQTPPTAASEEPGTETK